MKYTVNRSAPRFAAVKLVLRHAMLEVVCNSSLWFSSKGRESIGIIQLKSFARLLSRAGGTVVATLVATRVAIAALAILGTLAFATTTIVAVIFAVAVALAFLPVLAILAPTTLA